MYHINLILRALGVVLITIFLKALAFVIWRPSYITKRLRKQGVDGPPYEIYSGNLNEIKSLKINAKHIEMDINSHDIIPRVIPHYFKWESQYGGNFLYWFGMEPRICITDIELVKQILSNKFGFYPKPKIHSRLLAILGKGLVFAEGAEWARHKRAVSPAFTMDKLKVMTKNMADCTLSMLDKWDATMKHNAIEVNKQFLELTSNIISHTIFGSSYAKGKEVFLAQQELILQFLATSLSVEIPGFSYFPTKRNIMKRKLERKMKDTLLSLIQSRLSIKGSSYGDDLLGLLMESLQNQDGNVMSMDDIIDECKTFFFAGHETTSHLLTWTIFLLSTNLDWQVKLRDEVVRECGVEVPNADSLSKLRMVNMVLLEALRLYCPAIMITRQNSQEMTLGGIILPKNTTLSIPIPIIHRKKELWGEDANEFNPLRFENGIVKAAKHPNAMLSFSIGPRACIGQNFSMMEAKIVIAMILQRFLFTLSPDYKHMPTDMLTLQPQYGLPIVFKPIKDANLGKKLKGETSRSRQTSPSAPSPIREHQIIR